MLQTGNKYQLNKAFRKTEIYMLFPVKLGGYSILDTGSSVPKNVFQISCPLLAQPESDELRWSQLIKKS